MIRIATEADVPAMLSVYAPYVAHTTVSFEYDVPSQETFLHRFRDITAQFPWLLWEEDGHVLGYAYGSYPFERAGFAWCAEVSIYLKEEARGRGIGGKLYAVLETIMARQGYHLIYALVTEENQSSLRFHSKCGYFQRAVLTDCAWKFDRSLSLVWMEKRLKTGETPSAAPSAWMSIVQDAEDFGIILDSLSLS